MCLARKILTAAGNHYGQSDLVGQAAQLQLLLAWAEPRILVPGRDRDQSDEWEMQVGIKSRIAICMERYGLSHDQAVEHIKQVAQDEAEANLVGPAKHEPIAATMTPAAAERKKAAAQAQIDTTEGADCGYDDPLSDTTGPQTTNEAS